MRWCVTRPGPNTASQTTQAKAAMNITNDAEPRPMDNLDGSLTRRMFAISVRMDENRIAAIGVPKKCDRDSGSPTKTCNDIKTSRAVRTGSRHRSRQRLLGFIVRQDGKQPSAGLRRLPGRPVQ